MPFTFAHPAAVLPLRRLKFLQTVPLIIGSVVPDVHYFFPIQWQREFAFETHTLEGTFTLCLPMGMALLIMTLLLREPLTVLFSERARWLCFHALDRFSDRPLHWPIAMLSILIGSWTHLAWDSFTHAGGWMTRRVAALSAPVTIFGWQTETSHLLQYVSTAFGLTVLGIWLWRMWIRAPKPADSAQSWPLRYRLLLGAIVLVSVSFGFYKSLYAWHLGTYYRMVFILLTISIRWFLVVLLLAGIAIMLSRRPTLEPAR
jgi:hypothetical protein